MRMRPYQNTEDYWLIRPFLREVFQLNHRRQDSWPVARFDYWFSLGVQVFEKDWIELDRSIFLWETGDGQLAAVLNPEGRGEAYLHIHPQHRTPQLEAEMIATAEQYLGAPQPDGGQAVRIWTLESDTARQPLLASRGYAPSAGPESLRRQSLDKALPAPVLPPGFTVRALRIPEDLDERSLVGWKAFNGEDTPVPPTYANGQWLLVNLDNPLYRRELDLVVVAPNGDIAAFCNVWYDDVTRSGYFEPVGTAPAYQRQGLGRAILSEGMRRIQHLGADLAMVNSYSVSAGGLYTSAGFNEVELFVPWIKNGL